MIYSKGIRVHFVTFVTQLSVEHCQNRDWHLTMTVMFILQRMNIVPKYPRSSILSTFKGYINRRRVTSSVKTQLPIYNDYKAS